jgi:hypothetical protein
MRLEIHLRALALFRVHIHSFRTEGLGLRAVWVWCMVLHDTPPARRALST